MTSEVVNNSGFSILHFKSAGHKGNTLLAAHKHMWQSQVEIEHYSVAYFDRIAAFKVL